MKKNERLHVGATGIAMKNVTFISSCCGPENFPQTMAMVSTVSLLFPQSPLLVWAHGCDSTFEFAELETLIRSPRMFTVREERSDKSACIAALLPMVDTDYVCLVDNDVIVTGRDWMGKHLHLLTQQFDAVGGCAYPLVWCNARQPWKASNDNRCEVLNGAIITTTRATLRRIPYEDLPGCFLDDVVWSMRLRQAGKRVTFYPAEAVHRNDTNVYPGFDRKLMRERSLDEFHRVFAGELRSL